MRPVREVTGISDPTLSWRRLLLGRPRAFLARGPSPEPSSRASCGAFLQGVAEVRMRGGPGPLTSAGAVLALGQGLSFEERPEGGQASDRRGGARSIKRQIGF